MLLERGVDLPVEVVQQRRHAPELLVLAELPRVRAYGRFDRERMAAQRLAVRIAGEGLPGALASRLQARGTIAAAVSHTVLSETVVESFVIEGGRPLDGRVKAAGNKNGALPILAACLLTTEPVLLQNVPRILDVETMIALIRDLGVEVEWTGLNEVRVHAAELDKVELDAELASRIGHRSSWPDPCWRAPGALWCHRPAAT